MRDQIAEKLDEWENNFLGLETEEEIRNKTVRIFYGQKPSNVLQDDWNFIVYGMESIDKTGTNSQDLSGYYFVDIIREDYISDDVIFSIIKAMEEITGFKLCQGSNPIDYVLKGNTDIVCEMMRLRFTRPMKRININAEG